MRALVLFSAKNTPGKHDATGCFEPEAKRFARIHGLSPACVRGLDLVGIPYPHRKRLTAQLIHDAGSLAPLDALAFFGHGWANGIQFGYRRHEIPDLCALISNSATRDVILILYACLTAENDTPDHLIDSVGPGTDGGFADLLRDELVRSGATRGHCRVDAHKTRGHATYNPFFVRFEGRDDVVKGSVGGEWIVSPASPDWPRWVAALHDSASTLRYRFPFMTREQIAAELRGVPT